MTSFRIAMAGCALCLATAAAPAEAAKGVKKVNAATTPRTYSGVVISVNPNNSGFGTFYMRSVHHHKKQGMLNQAGNAAKNVNNSGGAHAFTVSSATQFSHHNGTSANAAMLHAGERVRVRAVANQGAGNQAAGNQAAGNQAAGNQVTGHHQAVAVQMLSHTHMRGHFTRHRSNHYHPQHHLQHHHHRR